MSTGAKTVTVEMSRTMVRIVKAASVREAMARFPSYVVECVDDVPVIGFCEACEQPILEGQAYGKDRDDCYVHKGRCPA